MDYEVGLNEVIYGLRSRAKGGYIWNVEGFL